MPQQRGSLVPVDDPSSQAHTVGSDADAKKQRLAKLKEQRSEFDTVTIGGSKKPKPKPPAQ
eukprot:CAMPEP_0174876164 /NCGR_PEP_ID=MMETSP1114-20130205/79619_1 /TAXON_ID=312471 /ORGANISM="Neobodo designis, Strain CCAP 1951/1" /LENGTH=60 /DNA_ID=CAMNT_0016111525 /DNA_START=88 /DNA_END=267 /DNA_ORIENTATION=-